LHICIDAGKALRLGQAAKGGKESCDEEMAKLGQRMEKA